MFAYCRQLISFSSDSSGSPVDLSNLTNAYAMFANCSALESFTSHLPSLTNGKGMFSECTNLTIFSYDSNGSPVNLSSLTNGYMMFYGCEKLTTFNSDLRSLTDGYGMFEYCNLDYPSIRNIADTLPNVESGNIHIGKVNTLDENYE